MKAIEYLEECREAEYRKLRYYSNNASCTIPSEGRAEEYKEARDRCQVVEDLIRLVTGEDSDEGPCIIDGKVEAKWQKVLKAGRRVMKIETEQITSQAADTVRSRSQTSPSKEEYDGGRAGRAGGYIPAASHCTIA